MSHCWLLSRTTPALRRRISNTRRPCWAAGPGSGRYPDPMPGFCRDCFADAAEAARRCIACGSPRLLRHAQLNALAIAHVDCDAFYATIEKRDDPSLADRRVEGVAIDMGDRERIQLRMPEQT